MSVNFKKFVKNQNVSYLKILTSAHNGSFVFLKNDKSKCFLTHTLLENIKITSIIATILYIEPEIQSR